MSRRRNGQPTVISGNGFTGSDGLTLEDWKDLSVTTATDAPRHIIDGWEGKILGYCSIELNNDNSAILNTKFNLSGTLWEQRAPAISAHRFWPDVDNGTTLHFPVVNSNVFLFNEGSLASELLGHDQITHFWRRDNNPVELDKGFSLRAYVAPSEETWATLWIILYPLGKRDLLEAHPLASNTLFPGLEVTCVHFQLGIQAANFLDEANYGSPLLPAVIPGAPWPESGDVTPPPATAVKKAISDTLRTALKPEIKKNFANLSARWNEIAENGLNALKTFQPQVIWPEVNTPLPPRGSFSVFPLFVFLASCLVCVFSTVMPQKRPILTSTSLPGIRTVLFNFPSVL